MMVAGGQGNGWAGVIGRRQLVGRLRESESKHMAMVFFSHQFVKVFTFGKAEFGISTKVAVALRFLLWQYHLPELLLLKCLLLESENEATKRDSGILQGWLPPLRLAHDFFIKKTNRPSKFIFLFSFSYSLGK
ncbi:hypothetical protein ACH5RR_003529 [Cinchona calisaya]|uniref:Uncharacterized protein n=1 Tax=Cinchona calisaya TaxID=153742 RepID=A0ABD3AVI0_9GENT